MMKKIVLFGGSFDPFHDGHSDIIKALIRSSMYDEVWLLLTNQNPVKFSCLTNFEHRFQILISNFKSSKSVKIYSFEKEVSSNYTYDTILHLKKKFPDYSFTFAIGLDQAKNLSTWYKINELKRIIDFVIFDRFGHKSSNFKVIDSYVTDISSTRIRKYPLKKISKETKHYIVKNQLYIDHVVKNKLSNKRYEHSVNVAKLAFDIAKVYGQNTQQAYLAGLLHDICKEDTIHKQLTYIPSHKRKQIKNLPKAIIHQYSGYYYIKNHLQIRDFKVLEAVKNHTTLSINHCTLDLIIYVADKLSCERDFLDKEYFLNLAFCDIMKCSIELFHFLNVERINTDDVKKILESLEKKYEKK